jgi:hypothetical protein
MYVYLQIPNGARLLLFRGLGRWPTKNGVEIPDFIGTFINLISDGKTCGNGYAFDSPGENSKDVLDYLDDAEWSYGILDNGSQAVYVAGFGGTVTIYTAIDDVEKLSADILDRSLDNDDRDYTGLFEGDDGLAFIRHNQVDKYVGARADALLQIPVAYGNEGAIEPITPRIVSHDAFTYILCDYEDYANKKSIVTSSDATSEIGRASCRERV